MTSMEGRTIKPYISCLLEKRAGHYVLPLACEPGFTKFREKATVPMSLESDGVHLQTEDEGEAYVAASQVLARCPMTHFVNFPVESDEIAERYPEWVREVGAPEGARGAKALHYTVLTLRILCPAHLEMVKEALTKAAERVEMPKSVQMMGVHLFKKRGVYFAHMSDPMRRAGRLLLRGAITQLKEVGALFRGDVDKMGPINEFHWHCTLLKKAGEEADLVRPDTFIFGHFRPAKLHVSVIDRGNVTEYECHASVPLKVCL